MKQQYEDYVEYQARLIINKLSKFIEGLFIQIRHMLDDVSLSLQNKNKEPILKLGLYFPIGMLLFILGMFSLLSSEYIFSPDYIVYFFFAVFASGIYLYRK